MGWDVDGAESDDCAAESQEEEHYYKGKEVSEDEAAGGNFKALPVDVFGGGYFLIFDEDGVGLSEHQFLGRFINTAAAHISHTGMSTWVEEVPLIKEL